MAIEIMSRVFKMNMGGSNRKLLALRLADFADEQGRGIWPSVGRLSTETELSERTVQRMLADFVKEGILVVRQKASGRPGDANRYDFDLARLYAYKPEPEAALTGDTVSPVGMAGTGDIRAETGDIDDRDGCHRDTRTVIEPPVEPSIEREGASENGQEDNPAAVEREFKRWYPTWPTYVDDSEPKARLAWQRLSAGDRARAAELTGAYVEAAKSSGRKYVCSAQIYLSEKRWEKLAELPKPKAAARPAGGRIPVPVFGPLWALAAFLPLLRRPVSRDLDQDHRANVLRTYEIMSRRGPQSGRNYLDSKGISLDEHGNPIFPEHFERDELRRLRKSEGYPETNRLYDAARSRSGATVPQSLEAMKSLMEAVPVDSETFQRWRDYYEAHFLPFPPTAEQMPVAYFPKGGPEAINEFTDAVAAALEPGDEATGRGTRNDAA